MRKLTTFPAAVITAGFLYGAAETVSAKLYLLGGVTPVDVFFASLLKRCLFYTVLSAAAGSVVWLGAVAAKAVSRRPFAPARAAAAAMLGLAVGANVFWVALAAANLKRFTFGGRAVNVWEPDGFFTFLVWPLALAVIAASYSAYKLFGRLKRPRRTLARAAVVAAAAWAVVIAVNVGQELRRPKPDPSAPDVVLITLDAWRADAWGPQLDGKSLTPNLDRFAEDALVFDHARAQASWTLPSFATIFTSQYPLVHGVRAGRPLTDDHPTLATILAARGYDTRAVVANELCLPFTGIPRGFRDYYYWNAVPWLNAIGYYETYAYYPAFRKGREEKIDSRITSALTDAALRKLSRRRGRPFFLWLHYLDPHAPYWPPPGYAYIAIPDPDEERKLPRDERALSKRKRYDGEVRYVDHELARILSAVAGKRHTLVIITSDHGEEFQEHWGFDHGHTVFEELLRVPLIIRFPGGAAGHVATPVDLIDLSPTILNYVGEEIPRSMQGRSLLPVVDGRARERPSFAGPYQLKGSKKEAVYFREKKLFYDYRYPDAAVWYDLNKDPGEDFQLTPMAPEAQKLWELLKAWRAANDEFRRHYGAGAESDAVRDAMRAMGYVD
jgi:arylsulfatase A-like enzyme